MHPYWAIWLGSLPQNPFYILLAIIALSCVGVAIWRELQLNSALNSFRSGHCDRALLRLERLQRFHLTHTALLFHKATVLLLADRNQDAEQVFRRCLKSPESTMQQSLILVNLGYLLLEQKRYAESAQALDEAIRMRPEGATAHSTRAEVFLRQGIEPERALELLDRGIQYKQASARQRHRDVHVLG
jgi:tetratricopeptide (TPR) repeat protein